MKHFSNDHRGDVHSKAKDPHAVERQHPKEKYGSDTAFILEVFPSLLIQLISCYIFSSKYYKIRAQPLFGPNL